ncbi:TetR/AcrR family transcriptional regulator [Acetobacterium bakii]|uniref:HTH tetR-type domain-containing protein n=1 Tax=Acetobacterium bakii TaxID=52689 RepID=A0A0L6U176_9FIRM|nr:TetR/AcrR family transcriptional regulator [Acetobacterium bakii]KNZ42259.1 hypothetical protein AKG39_07715 [Acetobacterium bakii]
MKQAEKGIRRKNQIATIALDQFIQKGYYGTSTREISKIAEISSGLMFHYFKNKQDLFHYLVQIGTEKMKFNHEMALDQPKNYLQNVAKYIFGQLQENEFFAKMFIFIDTAQHTVGIPDETKTLLQDNDVIRQCTPIFIKGQQTGEFRSGNAHAMCVAFFGTIQGVAQEKVRMPETPMPEVEWLMDMIVGERKVK